MKFKYLFFAALITLVACQKDDDFQEGIPIDNSFLWEGTEYDTPFAYLIFDTDAPYNDNYVLILSEQAVSDNLGNGVINFDTTTNHFVSFLVRNSNATVPMEQDVDVSVGNAPVDVGDSGAMIGITSWTDVVGAPGTPFGLPDNVNTFIDLDVPSAIASANILDVSLNYNTRGGSIDVSYSMTDGNGKTLSGQFFGPLKILNGF